MKVKTSIIIVTFNSDNFIDRCINSLFENCGIDEEVIVIDNSSSDQTVLKLKKFLPKIRLIESLGNLGFARANNKAVEVSNGEYLFFLNPDTEIKKPVFNELISFYQKDATTGIVGPKLVMPDETIQPSVMKLPTVWGAVKEFIFGIKHAYTPYVPSGKEPISVECLFGAAMLVKKDLFMKIGGFDKKFFLYYEDIDLCRRVLNLGYKIYYYPKVSIKHLVGGVKSHNKQDLNLESARKYHGWFKTLLLQLIFRCSRLFRS